MNIIKLWKFHKNKNKFVEKEIELKEDKTLTPGWWIRIGSKWTLHDKDNPFPIERHHIAEVLEIKEGWIKYRLGTCLPDTRPIKEFLSIYRELKGD